MVERLAHQCGVLGAPDGCYAPCGPLACDVRHFARGGNKRSAHEGKLKNVADLLGYYSELTGICTVHIYRPLAAILMCISQYYLKELWYKFKLV